MSVIHFITYNNAIPIALSLLLISSGAVFAASPEARKTIISEETKIRSVDNSYILSLNIENHNPTLRIVGIEEDTDLYYVSYTYNRVAIDNYVWKEVPTTDTLTVSKKALGGRDLGIYVAEEIGEILNKQEQYLTEVQQIEKGKGVTKKVATIEYSGLVGKMLRPKEEEFEGYVPVIPEKKLTATATENQQDQVSGIGSQNQIASNTPNKEEIRQIVQETVAEILAQKEGDTQPSPSQPSGSNDASDTEPPVITINGNNPAIIDVGSTYVDLGATVTDNRNNNLGITYQVNGVTVTSISIDTSTDVTYTITYSATDQAGNTGTATRTVIVGSGGDQVDEAPSSNEVVETEAATSTESESVSTPADTTAPIITILGEQSVTVTQGGVYTDQGATASDDGDGDITSSIITESNVNTEVAGTYSVTYSVSDVAGNTSSKTRSVIVEPVSGEGQEGSTATTTSTSSQ